jgi:hypothetical protein
MKGDNTLLSTYIDLFVSHPPCTVGRGGTRDEVSRINGWNQSLYFFYEGDQFTIFFFFIQAFFFFFFFFQSRGTKAPLPPSLGGTQPRAGSHTLL